MKTYLLKVLLPGVVAASALAYAASAGAQVPGPGGPGGPGGAPTAPTARRHDGHPAKAGHHVDMKAECQAMIARKQEMQAKLAAMDVDLDRAVAEMNAAKGSKTIDALEKPMMAVINELVAQHRAARTMMMAMQPEMMAHMMKHRDGRGGTGISCPMMSGGAAPEPKANATTPKP